VTGPGEPLDPVVVAWSASGEARARAGFGPWRLYRLESPSLDGVRYFPSRFSRANRSAMFWRKRSVPSPLR
jgi:hypothetical protein